MGNLLHAEIARGEDIHALQSKTSEHLHGPPSQPSNGDQLLDKVLVAGADEHLGGKLAGVKFLG